MKMNQLTLKNRILGSFGLLVIITAMMMAACYITSRSVASKTLQLKSESTVYESVNTEQSRELARVRQHLDEIAEKTNQLKQIVYSGGLLVVLAGLILAFLLDRSITNPITNIIKGLNAGSSGVSAAADQISASSRSFAGVASEQAASLEETSSSLEEMATMTKRNADDSRQADGLMQEANKVIATANNTMDDMTISMQQITQTSEETQKIVKTIDEIAFQTNLLALNAAVEAARAGEAGAGFAVVADEVRNLAIRAAEAAKNTSEMIDGSVKQIKEGSVQLDTTNKAFDEVAIMADKVTHLISEIAAASSEQASGIEQVSLTITDMDKRVQMNAAASEESASVSEEMISQSEKMRLMVDKLAALAGGGKSNSKEIFENAMIPEARPRLLISQ